MSGYVDVDEALVARLLAAQFPDWADLPIRPVDQQGWDATVACAPSSTSARWRSATPPWT